MYTPKPFAETDADVLHDFIERHSFATLISNATSGIVTSHLPLLLLHKQAAHGKLVGHFAKANPQSQTTDGSAVVAIFHGPHAYISPTWYEEEDAVPTWNYVSVHVHGRLHVLPGKAQRLDSVSRLVSFFESNNSSPWSVDQASDQFIDRLLDGIVAFEIVIESIEGQWKLSQNHSTARRERVITALVEGGDAAQRKVAELMAKQLVQHD